MNRKLVLLNLALLALLAALGWLIRQRWVQERTHERDVLLKSAQAKPVFVPPPAPLPKPVAPAEYVEVAQKMLFSSDRNPNVTVDPPPPPKPEPPMPPLPGYNGMMKLFGDPVVFLTAGKIGQKKYRVGDMIGPFKLISFDSDKIVFEWNGKTVERRPEELIAKESTQAEAPAPPPVQNVAAPSGPNVITIAPAGTANPNAPQNSKLGKENGTFRNCVPGDTSPPGTIVEGYKKRVTRGMFGETCLWEPVN